VKTPLLLHFTTVVLCSKNGKWREHAPGDTWGTSLQQFSAIPCEVTVRMHGLYRGGWFDQSQVWTCAVHRLFLLRVQCWLSRAHAKVAAGCWFGVKARQTCTGHTWDHISACAACGEKKVCLCFVFTWNLMAHLSA
jgi:hypothetical protein